MIFRDDTNELEKRVADAIFKACSGYMLRINCDAPARAAIKAMRKQPHPKSGKDELVSESKRS